MNDYFTNYDYIGATGNFPINDYIDYTSNILNTKIDNINIINSNIYSNLNILTSNTYHISKNNPDKLIDYNYNDYIQYGAIHTNIYINENQNSKLIFRPRYNNQAAEHKLEIRKDGRLYVYLQGNLIPLISSGWYCLNDELQNIFIVNTNQDIAISTIASDIVAINTTLISQATKIASLTILDTANGTYTIIKTQLDNFALWQYVVGGIVSGIGIAGAYTAVTANRAGNLADMINASFVSSNALNELLRNTTITPSEKISLSNQIQDIRTSNKILLTSNFYELGINQGFLNCNSTFQQFVPSLRTNKIIIGNDAPNSAFQLQLSGDANVNMLYLNNTSIQSILDSKQGTLSFNNPLLNNINVITLKIDNSLTLDASGNLSVVKTATTPLIWTGNDISLSYDGSLTKIGNNLSVVKTASLPLAYTTNNIALNYDSSLTLSGNNLSVSSGTSSKWTTSGTNIYNNNAGNVGIGHNAPVEKLDVNGNIYCRKNLTIGTPSFILSPTSYSGSTLTSIAGTNESYLQYSTTGTLFLEDSIACDLLVVGAGGNGGSGAGGGGGGAGEVIYYPNYIFNPGSYSITSGISSTNINSRISKITSNSVDIIKATGGGDGGSSIYQTFNYSTNAIQTFNIPTGVSSITIYCWGAGGGNTFCATTAGGFRGAMAGNGGFVKATLTIPSGTTSLAVIVGQGGRKGVSNSSSGNAFGGGGLGSAGNVDWYIGGGGGFSGVFINDANMTLTGTGNYKVNTNATPIIIAGGGGAGGGVDLNFATTYNYGGNGGDTTANNSSGGNIGGGGTQSTGGTGSTGNTGSKFAGGNADNFSGGGGSGWYGGGTTDASTGNVGGGGGGSSYVNTGSYTLTNITNSKTATNGTATAPGNTETYYQSGIAVGAPATTSTAALANGGNGLVIIEYPSTPSSGGSGGGGYISTVGANAGTPFNTTYSYLNAGSSGTASQGGNGGFSMPTAVRFSSTITGSLLSVGGGGTGATSSSTPTTKTNYGDGGDGNGGVGYQGIVIIRFKESSYLSIKSIPNNANSGLIINGNYDNNKNQLRISSFIDGLQPYTFRGYRFDMVDTVLGTGNNCTPLSLMNFYGKGRIAVNKLFPYSTLDVAGDLNCEYFSVVRNINDNSTCSIQNQNSGSFANCCLNFIQDANTTSFSFYSTNSTIATPKLFEIYNQTSDIQLKTTGGKYLYLKRDYGIGINKVPSTTDALDIEGTMSLTNTINGGHYLKSYNFSGGSSAYCSFQLINSTGNGCSLFLNSSGRSSDGGINCATLRNDVGNLVLSTAGNTPSIALEDSTNSIYMNGIVNVRQSDGGGSYALPNGRMSSGSLTIGSINNNYGGGTGGWNSSTAGLLLECSDNTEIAVHDSGTRLCSLFYYEGGLNYNIYIGREMGYGKANNIFFACNYINFAYQYWSIGVATPAGSGTANSLVFLHNDGASINSKWWLNGTQTSTSSEISDLRIKKEIKEIDDASSLLLKLKPKEYKLCEDKDYNRKFGIIAQDVEKEENLKDFIFKEQDYIANCLFNGEFIKEQIGIRKGILDPNVNYEKTEDNPTPPPKPKDEIIYRYMIKASEGKQFKGIIDINDEIKIVLDNDDHGKKEIIMDDTPYNNRYKRRFTKVINFIDDYTIEINGDLNLQENEKDKLFIYGKKVEDFHKLDYQSLYCLNIKATQELIIRNNELERIQDLQQRTIDELLLRLARLEEKISNL